MAGAKTRVEGTTAQTESSLAQHGNPSTVERIYKRVSQAFTHQRVTSTRMSSDLRQAISRFVRDEYFEEWLRTPNPLMENRTPAELLELGREDLIWKAIETALNVEG